MSTLRRGSGHTMPRRSGQIRRRPRKRFGQHFLEQAWVDKLVAAIDPAPTDEFIEIGPGWGPLTLALAPRVHSLVAVEIDRDLAADLSRRAPPNVHVIAGDFLRTPLDELRAGREAGTRSLRVAGNLPYNVGSPILFRLLNDDLTAQPYYDATLMLQREVADRLVAKPGSKDYGVLTILVRVHADVTRLLALPPGAFRPPPAVHSAVVRLNFRPPAIPVQRLNTFRRIVRVLFNQRRKTLANALGPLSTPSLSARQALEDAQLDAGRRPETLELEELARLADVLEQVGAA